MFIRMCSKGTNLKRPLFGQEHWYCKEVFCRIRKGILEVCPYYPISGPPKVPSKPGLFQVGASVSNDGGCASSDAVLHWYGGHGKCKISLDQRLGQVDRALGSLGVHGLF